MYMAHYRATSKCGTRVRANTPEIRRQCDMSSFCKLPSAATFSFRLQFAISKVCSRPSMLTSDIREHPVIISVCSPPK